MRALLLAGAGIAAAFCVQAQSLRDYGRECARQVVEVPSFSCADGVPVPITVNGKVPDRYTPGMLCDRPSMLPPDAGQTTDGQCVPNSRALLLRDDDVAQISAFCRQKMIRPADSPLYDEIDVIAHNVRNGRTCWFQATLPGPLKADKGVDGRRVPSPTATKPPRAYPQPSRFWNPPRATAKLKCVNCHDSGPYMYSPFIAQVKQVIPSDPFGPYRNDVGAAFRAWPKPFGITTDGNTCTSCHRMGNMNSCHIAMYQSFGAMPVDGLDEWGHQFPQSHWMPPGNLHSLAQWNQAYGESIAKLAACCRNPKLPQCQIVHYDKTR